VGKGPTR